MNHQSVTASVRRDRQSELDSVGGSGEPSTAGRSPNKIVRPALRKWNASGREPQMVGDRMVGSSGDVNQGTTAGDDERAGRGQSVRSSEEASNDRGAKGGRKAVLAVELRPSHQGRHSAARLCVSGRWKTAWSRWACWQWAARDWVSESVRIARLVCSLRTSRNTNLSQPIGGCRLESRMPEICQSGLGGRGSALRSSYPHRWRRDSDGTVQMRPVITGQAFRACHKRRPRRMLETIVTDTQQAMPPQAAELRARISRPVWPCNAK